ncbi:heparinase II/III domain-containing protein [Pistricoccus aurantiacus]|uniref:heparinase II/III domain-containing protein n=1 Tax=Pistricoccus aurantiacus TaxID=1883414 RepID=UPI0036296717
MTTKDLLAYTTPKAIRYIQKAVHSKSKTDYQKLKKLFDEKKFEARNFDDSELDILIFDWQSLERDRNWWWQLQALPFLNWYTNSLALQSEEERTRYFSQCLDALHCWINHAKLNGDSPLAWHDHATAFRVRNLTNWLLFCHIAGLSVSEEPRAEPLASLVIEHLDWMQEDKHYSKHSNHGFDQAMIALSIGLMFARNDFEPYRQQNRKRLKDEMAFAFTDEGVHKENSPGYQKMALGRLNQLLALASLGEQEISRVGERYIEKADAFLKAITLPNGYLPMIGDTKGEDKGLAYEQKDNIDILDYSRSGYIIVRGTVLEKDFHLVFKASHLSHYHRHDDDLSIHLYFGDKVLLGDGGLGYYNEKDEKRVSLRSSISHNVPYILDQEPVRKVSDLDEKKPEVFMLGKVIIGESYCFGDKVRRELDLSSLPRGKLVIKDSANKDIADRLVTNFYSASGLYEAQGDLLLSIDDGHALKIKLKKGHFSKENPTYFSDKFGKFSKASSFTIVPDENTVTNIEVELDLSYPNKSLYEIFYRGYGPIKVKEKNGWFFDESYPGNVCHHIMSLRWINKIKSLNIKESILEDFISYHQNPGTRKSKYYLGKGADHTSSVRLVVLSGMLAALEERGRLAALLKTEIVKNIESCLNETYKINNNHGLMVDKTLLQCFSDNAWLLKKYCNSVAYVIDRVENQLHGIFDDEGYCKEHSNAYQEFNLGVCLEFRDVLNEAEGLIPKQTHIALNEFFDKIIEASKMSLGWLLKSDGHYIPIGDSTGKPKGNILKHAYGSNKPGEALLPYSTEKGVFHNATLGVSVFRNKEAHILLNSCWHSYVHKQNDDLSIFMRLNGEDVVVDGGYSGIIDRDKVNTRSEYLHSTVIPIGKKWLERSAVNRGVSKLYNPRFVSKRSQSLVCFSGEHTRVDGFHIERKLKIDNDKKAVLVLDKASPKVDCLHRFIIPKHFNVSVAGDVLRLVSDCNDIIVIPQKKFFSYKKNVTLKCELINCVVDNKVSEAYAVDFISNGYLELLFKF